MTILVLEYMGLYFLQVSYKAFVYAVKLKCEVSILNRLANFVKSAAGGGYGAAAIADNNNLLDGRAGGQRRFQDFDSFQLSSQVEREWETTLRNTFGVALAHEEKRDVVVVEDERHRHNHDDDDDDALPSPSAALVAGARASSSSGSSGSAEAEGKTRTRTTTTTTRSDGGGRRGGHGLLETFGVASASNSRNSVGSLGGDGAGRGGPLAADRRSSASSGLVVVDVDVDDAADVLSVVGSSLSSSENPRKGILHGPQVSAS